MVKVLFVCMGNVCRSPMAEAVMRHKVEQAGLSHAIAVDSAGEEEYHVGDPPHKGTRKLLDRHGISYAGMVGRKMTRQDFHQFDHIVCMDRENVRACLRLCDQKFASKISLLADFVEGGVFSSGTNEVPDPWYTGNFQLVYDLVEQGCTALLAEILRKL